MSTALRGADRELTEAEVTERESRHLIEESALAPVANGRSAVAADGTVLVHVIRPCVGKGKGKHVYEADMLKRHADSGHFVDWPMFIDHESPGARRAAGGLPRSVKDLGGRIVEHWWDDKVPAEGRFGAGAVVARVLPVPDLQKLIEHDPKLLHTSLNTYATGVRSSTRGPVVEGFEHDGSLDWVTRAGAGGKVIELLEAAYDDGGHMDDEYLRGLLTAMPKDRLSTLLRESRPELAEAINDAGTGEEDDDVKPEELREAVETELRSDTTKNLIAEAVKDALSDSDAVQESVKDALREVLPGAIGKAAEVIEAQVTESAKNAMRMGALRTKAEEVVREAKLDDGSELPERVRQDVLEHIGTPNVEDVTDDDGKVTETAEARFDKLLEAELKRARELVEAARPAPAGRKRRTQEARVERTAVTGNGGGGGDDEGKAVVEAEDDDDERLLHRTALQEAGVDLHAAWGIGKKPEKATA